MATKKKARKTYRVSKSFSFDPLTRYGSRRFSTLREARKYAKGLVDLNYDYAEVVKDGGRRNDNEEFIEAFVFTTDYRVERVVPEAL